MKPYVSNKSYFSKDFYHEEIHVAIERVLSKINASGFYKEDDIQNITFRYKGTLYRLATKKAQRFMKGIKDPIEFLRVATFFPIEEDKMLKELESDFTEQPIDDELSVFTRKKSPATTQPATGL